MIIQGTLAAVVPPDYSNQHGVQYQNITVNTPTAGSITGRLGTKTPYNQQDIGTQVQLECEQAQNQNGFYNKFKKYNPSYAQQGGQKSPQQATRATNNNQRDYDAENRGKCRTQFIKAAIIAGGLNCTCYEHVLELTEFAMTGIIPQNSQPQRPPDSDDDIPF